MPPVKKMKKGVTSSGNGRTELKMSPQGDSPQVKN